VTGTTTIDVTESVRAWIDGETNYGWAFLPLGGDGWDFVRADGESPPRLRIEYDPPDASDGGSEGDESEGESSVTKGDADVVQEHISNKDVDIDTDAADMDGDGDVDIGDAVRIRRKRERATDERTLETPHVPIVGRPPGDRCPVRRLRGDESRDVHQRRAGGEQQSGRNNDPIAERDGHTDGVGQRHERLRLPVEDDLRSGHGESDSRLGH